MPSLLLICPDQAYLDAAASQLASAGYSFASAPAPQTGLELALTAKPDLVLLDSILAEMGEIRITDVLVREQPEIPLILLDRLTSATPLPHFAHVQGNFYTLSDSNKPGPFLLTAIERALAETQLRNENRRLEQQGSRLARELADHAGAIEWLKIELRVANERLAELDRAHASVLSTLPHELRHPLAVAKGYLELILTGEPVLDENTLRYLDIAQSSLKDLSQLLDDLLDLSRLETGRYRVDQQVEDVRALITQALRAIKPAADTKKITLENLATENVPFVMADPLRISQVLANLLDNARKFTAEGGAISVSTSERPQQVEVIISDSGVGIPAADLERIFDRFYQVKNPALPTTGGAGLGLAICREIIRLHGGQIWATSELSCGSQFHFTLPKAEDKPE